MYQLGDSWSACPLVFAFPQKVGELKTGHPVPVVLSLLVARQHKELPKQGGGDLPAVGSLGARPVTWGVG